MKNALCASTALGVWLAAACLAATGFAQPAPPAPPALPPTTPAADPAPAPPALTAAPAAPAGPAAQSTNPPPVNWNSAPPKKIVRPPAGPPRPSPISWDSMSKEYTAKPGETTNMFTFWVTNISKSVVYIDRLQPSCGCTVAKLPHQPWRLDPGSNGVTYVTVNFAGKHGLVTKSVGVSGSELGAVPTEPTHKLNQTLIVKINIPNEPAGPASSNLLLASRAGMGNRNANIESAKVDRQAVFKGDCASCHAAPAAGKMGEPLFHAVCGVCHESPQRATMVPDLTSGKVIRDENYWLSWVKFGKAGTLMPGFLNSKAVGGPLTTEQIQSLVSFLKVKYSAQPSVLK